MRKNFKCRKRREVFFCDNILDLKKNQKNLSGTYDTQENNTELNQKKV